MEEKPSSTLPRLRRRGRQRSERMRICELELCLVPSVLAVSIFILNPMISSPYRLSRPDRYCRLLPPFQYPGDPRARLEDLARSMLRDAPPAPPMAPMMAPAVGVDMGEGVPAVAYTYFGQFIMHDLTFDDTPFHSAGLQEPEETINYRNPRLDLDSVYGDGPFSGSHRHLYDGVRFLVGTKARNPQGALFDVPLIDDLPAVADDRNCENAILRQIHAMFLKLHNRAVDNLAGSITEVDKLFEAARRLVRWQFQWLVRYDYLPKICDLVVYDELVRKNRRLIHWPPGSFSIPVEFSQAAARFGHSMVRQKYRLSGGEFNLGQLFGSCQRAGPLEDGKAVGWSHFVGPRDSPARDIDTTLENPFRELPQDTIHSFVRSPMPHDPLMLPFRTLARGAATRLPTGQQLRVALDPLGQLPDPDPENDTDLQKLRKTLQKLRDLGFDRETPLWFYILLEAQTQGKKQRLGTVGSRLVAEVIEAALRHDPDSFLFDTRGEWTREPWTHGETSTSIGDLWDLAAVIGLEPGRPPEP